MSKYQTKLINEFESQGWGVIKLSKTNKNGIADLLIARPGHIPYLIEVKERTDTIKPLQIVQNLNMARKMGFKFEIWQDGIGQVDYSDMIEQTDLF